MAFNIAVGSFNCAAVFFIVQREDARSELLVTLRECKEASWQQDKYRSGAALIWRDKKKRPTG